MKGRTVPQPTERPAYPRRLVRVPALGGGWHLIEVPIVVRERLNKYARKPVGPALEPVVEETSDDVTTHP